MVDLDRVAPPLVAVLRLAFAATAVGALLVDWWVLSDGGERRALPAVAVVAMIGVAWAWWPRAAQEWAVAAAVCSLLITSRTSVEGVRLPLFTEFVVLPVLFGAVLASAGWWRWGVALFVAGAAEAIALRAADRPVELIVAVSMLVLLGTATTAIGYIRLRDSERRTSIERARQNERLELARELHDVVGHHVTGIVVLAQASRFTAATSGGDVAQHEETLSQIERAGVETLTSIRRLVGLLRSDSPTTAGPSLDDAQQVVTELRRTHPLTELEIDAAIRTSWVPDALAPTVLRLLQESATNIRKYGEPSGAARIVLRRSGGAIELRAENRIARGSPSAGYGLIGMRERVDALGGTFAAGADGSGGWIVWATLPWTGDTR